MNENETDYTRPRLGLVEDDALRNGQALNMTPITSMEVMMTGIRWASFKKTANPVLALEAFLLAIDSGVYPPTETLRWLAAAFKTWHDSQGIMSMDKALGLTPGRGQTPPFKRLMLDERNEMLMLDMDRLIYIGATRQEAAVLVAGKLATADWNKSKFDMPDLSADTLIHIHAHGHKPFDFDHKDAQFPASVLAATPMRDEAWVADWLRTFDVAYMPERLKSRL